MSRLSLLVYKGTLRHVTGSAFVISLAAALSAQNQVAEPRFEAASIKRNTTDSSMVSVGAFAGAGWHMTNGTVLAIIHSAFPTKNREVVGLPSWADTERYDVVTTVANRPSREDEQVMLRGLLADRFNFRGHVEQREVPVFALVIARPGQPLPPALSRLSTDCAAVFAARRRGESVVVAPLSDGAMPCGYSINGGTQLVLKSDGMTMERLADSLTDTADRPVIDRTGLTGDFAFTLTYDLPRTNGGVGDTPTLFTALPEQLGLKLESARAPVDTLVIDHIERPSEN